MDIKYSLSEKDVSVIKKSLNTEIRDQEFTIDLMRRASDITTPPIVIEKQIEILREIEDTLKKF